MEYLSCKMFLFVISEVVMYDHHRRTSSVHNATGGDRGRACGLARGAGGGEPRMRGRDRARALVTRKHRGLVFLRCRNIRYKFVKSISFDQLHFNYEMLSW